MVFIRKSKIKDYNEKKHKKEIEEINNFWQKQNKEIIREKNEEIKKLKKQRENYLDKSLSQDDNINRIKNLKHNLLMNLGKLVHDCDEIMNKNRINEAYVLKNEHKLRGIK